MQSVKVSQVWLCEFVRNGMIFTVIALFNGLKRAHR